MAVIYFAKAEDDEAIKIGVADDAAAKVSRMQGDYPARLVLLGTIPYEDGLEHRLHRRFAQQRIRGEWFAPSRPLLDLIEESRKHPAKDRPQKREPNFAVRTPFGKFLRSANVSPGEAAAEIGVTRAYVLMLAAGTTPPRMRLAFRIAEWARKRRGSVPVESWEAFCR